MAVGPQNTATFRSVRKAGSSTALAPNLLSGMQFSEGIGVSAFLAAYNMCERLGSVLNCFCESLYT